MDDRKGVTHAVRLAACGAWLALPGAAVAQFVPTAQVGMVSVQGAVLQSNEVTPLSLRARTPDMTFSAGLNTTLSDGVIGADTLLVLPQVGTGVDVYASFKITFDVLVDTPVIIDVKDLGTWANWLPDVALYQARDDGGWAAVNHRDITVLSAGTWQLAGRAHSLSYALVTQGHVSIRAVPEPGTCGLMGLGLVALGWQQRRRALA